MIIKSCSNSEVLPINGIDDKELLSSSNSPVKLNPDTIDNDDDFSYQFKPQRQLKSPINSPCFSLLHRITSTNTQRSTSSNLNINDSSSPGSPVRSYANENVSSSLQSNANSFRSQPVHVNSALSVASNNDVPSSSRSNIVNNGEPNSNLNSTSVRDDSSIQARFIDIEARVSKQAAEIDELRTIKNYPTVFVYFLYLLLLEK